EFAPLRQAGCVVALGINAQVAAVLRVAGPGNHEIAVGIQGHAGVPLNAGRVGIDAELAPLRHARRVVTLRIDAIVAAVLAVADPGNPDVADDIQGDTG